MDLRTSNVYTRTCSRCCSSCTDLFAEKWCIAYTMYIPYVKNVHQLRSVDPWNGITCCIDCVVLSVAPEEHDKNCASSSDETARQPELTSKINEHTHTQPRHQTHCAIRFYLACMSPTRTCLMYRACGADFAHQWVRSVTNPSSKSDEHRRVQELLVGDLVEKGFSKSCPYFFIAFVRLVIRLGC